MIPVNQNRIAFLVNPASGTKASKKQAAELMEFLSKHPEYELIQTNTAAEMAEVTADLAKRNYQAVFGCGGDGTLNLISKHLQGSDTALGMIGLGSGNGFVRHQKIPLRWDKALKAAESPVERIVDTGMVNGIHFLNIAGIGFAAKISHAFKGVVNRGLSGYAKTVLTNLKLDPFSATISNENSSWQGETWMVDFCNGSQWGNNFRIEPGARDDDGAFSAVVFKKMSPVKIPALGFRFAANSVPESPDVYTFSGTRFVMDFDGIRPLHVDGEAIAMVENQVVVEVVPKNLKIWTL